MEWKFYVGACLLVGALVIPQAGWRPTLAGMALAGALLWGWRRVRPDEASRRERHL